MKKKLLVSVMCLMLVGCSSGVSQSEFESVSAAASVAESEKESLLADLESVNSEYSAYREQVASNEKASETGNKTVDFNTHNALGQDELIYFHDKERLRKMVECSFAALLDAGIDSNDSDFIGLENYEKHESDTGKQNAGFRIDVIISTKLRKLSCPLYYFENSDKWTFLGLKNYESPHWYHVNGSLPGIDSVQLYDYETDTLIK